MHNTRELRYRSGEDHPNAVLTNAEVEQIRQLHEGGLGYKRIAAKCEIGVRTVRDIVSFRRRPR